MIVKPVFVAAFLFTKATLLAQQTRVISDCTIYFTVTSAGQTGVSSKVLYLKGKELRVDFISSTFTQTMILGKNGGATILKTVGESKYVANYNHAEWTKHNQVYAGIKTTLTNETKNILNYTCKKAILQLANGNVYAVYYVPGLIPSVKENAFEFKDIPGLILEYESIGANSGKVIYTATKIDFSPVPAAQFEIPKAGYRVLH